MKKKKRNRGRVWKGRERERRAWKEKNENCSGEKEGGKREELRKSCEGKWRYREIN